MATIIEIVVCSILIALICLVIVPILTYYLYLYYSHRSNPIIHKRHYGVMIAYNIFSMLSLIGDKSLYMVSICITDSIQQAHNHIIYEISDYVYFFVGPAIILFFCFMTWMVFYDISWAIITNPDNKWTHFINTSFNTISNQNTDKFSDNWFIKNQPKYGNSKWLTKHIFIPICTLIYVSLFASLYVDVTIHYYVFMLWMIICALFCAIIYYNIPRQQIEIFKIKKQTDKMMICWVSFVVCFGFYLGLRVFITDPEYQFIIILPFQYAFTAIYFWGGLLSTRYVLIECDLVERINTERSMSLKKVVANMIEIPQLTGNVENGVNGLSHLSLARILSSRVSFNAFMSHLLKEFSSENLLCILECWQFKSMVNDKNQENEIKFNGNSTPSSTIDNTSKNEDNNNNVDEIAGDNATKYISFHELLLNEALKQYTFPSKDDIPQSIIVYDNKMTIEEKATKLINKYVYSPKGCLFEVNISSPCKYSMIRKSMEINEIEMTLQQLYDLFDEMILELIRLLNDSHVRFLQTEDYKQLIAHDIV